MSLTSTVPPAEPSLFHSSRPCTPSFATENKVPLTLVSPPGYEPPAPGTMHARAPCEFAPARRAVSFARRGLPPACRDQITAAALIVQYWHTKIVCLYNVVLLDHALNRALQCPSTDT